jgi:uncharacterized protein YhfF
MRLEPKTEHQKMMDAWIADVKDGQKGRTACQEATETNPEEMRPNPGEKEVIAEWQENPNEEVALHSLRACQNKRMACQEGLEARSREDGAN